MRSGWKRAVLWTLVGVVVILLALAVGFYVWFQNQVGASNARVDPAIVEALKEKPSTTLTTARPTTTSAPPSTTLPPTSTSSSETTTTSEITTTTAPFETPSGMNIVLLGFDKRPEGSSEVTEGRSDTIILVHLDPEKDFLSVLSVPRDLRAKVPGYGHRKINAAYAYGGGALLIRTIQNELGVDLDHYIAVDLEAFKAITDELGGVYVDVDRTYDDGKIELDPGYQLLDGLNALRFCRTRHDQNIDFGRMERQQRFLSAARQQVMGWNLPLRLPGMISALFKNMDTDLSANEVIKLVYWMVKIDGGSIKRAEIIGPTGDINGSFYILPSEEQLAAAVNDFFTPPEEAPTGSSGSSVTPPSSSRAALTPANLGRTSVDVVNASGRTGQGALAAVWLAGQNASVAGITQAEEMLAGQGQVRYPAGRATTAGNVAEALGIQQVVQTRGLSRVTVVLGDAFLIEASQVVPDEDRVVRPTVWRSLSRDAGLVTMAPTYLPSALSHSFGRSYDLTVGDGSEPAVRVGYRYKSEDLYAGVSATTWLDAPLASPGIGVPGDGVVYTVVGTNNKADHVWWVKDKVLYWVSNTLFCELTAEQLLAIAVSAVPVSAGG